MEGRRMLQWKLDTLLQRTLRIGETPNIVPTDIGDLNHDLTEGRGLDPLHRILEVTTSNNELLEDLRGNRSLLELDLRKMTAESLDRSLSRSEERRVGKECRSRRWTGA